MMLDKILVQEEKVSKKLVCWTMKKVIGSNFALFHR